MRIEPLIGIAAGGLIACVSIALLILVLRKNRAARSARNRTVNGQDDPGADAAQLKQFARRIDGELADRIERMAALLREADGKIEELHRLISAAGGQGASALRRPDDETCVEIDRLARRGLDALEIARRTNLAVGEVELLLRLRQCRKTPIEIENK